MQYALGILGFGGMLLGAWGGIRVNRLVQLPNITGATGFLIRAMIFIIVYLTVSAPIIYGLSAFDGRR